MKKKITLYTNYSAEEISKMVIIENFRDLFGSTVKFSGFINENKISISTIESSPIHINGIIQVSDNKNFKTKIILSGYCEYNSDIAFKILITFIYSIAIAYYSYLIANHYTKFWVYLLIIPFSILPYLFLKLFFFLDKYLCITHLDYPAPNEDRITILVKEFEKLLK